MDPRPPRTLGRQRLPDQLAGDKIPAEAQLLALADAWHVMTESRTYKLPKTTEEALADVREQ